MATLTDEALSALLIDVESTARNAGAVIESFRSSGNLAVTTKEDQSPVTLADKGADDLLRTELSAMLPSAGWLSEETAEDPKRRAADLVWIVDPLDGTKEFIAGVPQYAVSVGLVDRGQVVLGVVHNPATGDTFSAIRRLGAWRNGQRLQVATGTVLLASRSETRRGEFEAFRDWKLVEIGSIALKLALVAAGEGSVTVSRGPKWEWDVCAGSLLVRESAGLVSDATGQPFSFNQDWPKVRGVIAGAPPAYDRVLERVMEIGVSDRMSDFEPDRS